MSSNFLLEDWLKSCDAITYFNYSSKYIMNLLKDFKLVFTQQKWLTNLILTESMSKTLSELTKKLICGFLGVYFIFNSFSIPFFYHLIQKAGYFIPNNVAAIMVASCLNYVPQFQWKGWGGGRGGVLTGGT